MYAMKLQVLLEMIETSISDVGTVEEAKTIETCQQVTRVRRYLSLQVDQRHEGNNVPIQLAQQLLRRESIETLDLNLSSRNIDNICSKLFLHICGNGRMRRNRLGILILPRSGYTAHNKTSCLHVSILILTDNLCSHPRDSPPALYNTHGPDSAIFFY